MTHNYRDMPLFNWRKSIDAH